MLLPKGERGTRNKFYTVSKNLPQIVIISVEKTGKYHLKQLIKSMSSERDKLTLWATHWDSIRKIQPRFYNVPG